MARGVWKIVNNGTGEKVEKGNLHDKYVKEEDLSGNVKMLSGYFFVRCHLLPNSSCHLLSDVLIKNYGQKIHTEPS